MAPLLLVGAAVGGATMYLFDRGHHHSASDDVLVKRVRSTMSHYVAHPGAIEVSAAAGRVTLKGSILAHEHPELLDALYTMQGVSEIVDHLSVFETAEGISEPRRGHQNRRGSAALPQTWAPGAMLAAGTGLGLCLLRKSTRVAVPLLVAAGLAALLRLKPEQHTRSPAPIGTGKPAEAPSSELSIAPEEVF